MVRYQSNQNIKKKFESKQTFLAKNSNLRTRNKTILKTNTACSKDKLNNKSRLKRKVLVYKKNDKFYIDHFVAYALKLTNVRAVMLDNPHLVEVGMETLYRWQNDEDIEIEYQNIDRKKGTTTREEGNLAKDLDELEQGEYGIAIHGIDTGNSTEKQRKASNIMDEGLNINDNSKTILSTAISLGTNDDVQGLRQNITQYNFGNGIKMNVIIAVPLYIQNRNGQRIFLGFPEENKRTAGQQYEEHCILDQICGKLKKVPPEFILGYYCENADNSVSFIKNLKHYSNIEQEQKEDLYQELSLNMNDTSKKINELIESGNIEQLTQMKEKVQRLDLNAYMVDNAMRLAQKYKEQQDKAPTNSIEKRKILLDHLEEEPSGNGATASTEKRKTRRILLNSYEETKLSDLSEAREILKDGVIQKERNYEGKEV